MKLGAKIRQVIDIFRYILFLPVSFLQPQPPVIHHFRLRSGQFKPRIPCPAVSGTEPRPAGARMAERSVDDAIGGNSKYQFPRIEAGKLPRLRQQPVVGSIVELENAVKNIFVVGQACQYRRASVCELCRNQAMRIPLIDSGSTHDQAIFLRAGYRANGEP